MKKYGVPSQSGGHGLPKLVIKIWSHRTKHTFIAGRQTTQRDLERKDISFLNATALFAIYPARCVLYHVTVFCKEPILIAQILEILKTLLSLSLLVM